MVGLNVVSGALLPLKLGAALPPNSTNCSALGACALPCSAADFLPVGCSVLSSCRVTVAALN